MVAEHANIRCAANVRSFKELAWIDGNAGEINILAFFPGFCGLGVYRKKPIGSEADSHLIHRNS